MCDKQDIKCMFSINIAEELTCSKDGEFDDYGFPVDICPLFPCKKYQELLSKIK